MLPFASLGSALLSLNSGFQVIFHIFPPSIPGWISSGFSYLASNL